MPTPREGNCRSPGTRDGLTEAAQTLSHVALILRTQARCALRVAVDLTTRSALLGLPHLTLHEREHRGCPGLAVALAHACHPRIEGALRFVVIVG